jgi:hypothetical protein
VKFRTCDTATLFPKLRDILGGPPLPNEEDENSNHARNILFELNLAAKLWVAGLAPTLGERPDLYCEVAKKRLLIECKRPLTRKGARKRIGKAWSTLTQLAKSDLPGTRGVVALSVTKLINPGDAIFTASDVADARTGLGSLLSGVTDQLGERWEHPGTKVIGVIFHVITPAFLEDRKLLVLQQRTHGHGLSRPGSLDSDAFRTLMESLKAVWY